MVWAYGLGIWSGHMVWAYGLGIWSEHMASHSFLGFSVLGARCLVLGAPCSLSWLVCGFLACAWHVNDLSMTYCMNYCLVCLVHSVSELYLYWLVAWLVHDFPLLFAWLVHGCARMLAPPWVPHTAIRAWCCTVLPLSGAAAAPSSLCHNIVPVWCSLQLCVAPYCYPCRWPLCCLACLAIHGD